MKILIAMDDTDNLESPGTGHILEEFRSYFREREWGATEAISRHQLLVDPRVPYTSHNSTMCFSAEIEPDSLDGIRKKAADFLVGSCASGSDPGLAIAVLDNLSLGEELEDFGRMAQSAVLTKEKAYGLADKAGVFLSEHGGTGDGIIGALAGIGLRLSGDDGRFRGQLEGLSPDKTYSLKEIVDHKQIDSVIIADPGELPEDRSPSSLTRFLEAKRYGTLPDCDVFLYDKIKTVFRFHQSVLLLCYRDGRLTNWSKEELKAF